MICINFDQVMQHLIPKFQKRSQFFQYFAFFSIRKAASHMIFPFLELLKIYPQQRKKSHDQKSHDSYDLFFSFHNHHQMLQFFLLSGLFLICFPLVLLDQHESFLNFKKLPNQVLTIWLKLLVVCFALFFSLLNMDTFFCY